MVNETNSRKDKLNNFLKVNRLDTPTRKAITKDLYKLGDYHDGIPMDKIRAILDKHQMVLLQEDYTEYSAIFCGREGVARIMFGYKATSYLVNDIPTYIAFDNSLLILTWYKLQSKYEIITYLS